MERPLEARYGVIQMLSTWELLPQGGLHVADVVDESGGTMIADLLSLGFAHDEMMKEVVLAVRSDIHVPLSVSITRTCLCWVG